jgi:hypothetical protein
MTTSPQTFTLSKPVGNDPVPAGTLGYFRARNKYKVYGLVLQEFKKSGISQADLARRLRKAPEVVCRLLGSPGNWTLDTVSDFLFAISAAEPKYDLAYPLDKPARNYVRQDQFAQPAKVVTATTQDTTSFHPNKKILDGAAA